MPFLGFHSEWNLGSPGGYDYQRVTQQIAKSTWQQLNQIQPVGVELDFDHPALSPIIGFCDMLVARQRHLDGGDSGFIAVVAEEETLEEVGENINLAKRLGGMPGVSSVLCAPQALELRSGRMCHQGQPVSLAFLDFNNDVLLKLHRQHDLSPLIAALEQGRVINPRGTEPINVKSMFEVITTPSMAHRFDPEIVQRTPWTRRFFQRRTQGPQGEPITDLVEWTRSHWPQLVLKPERGYSGIGVKVGAVHPDADAAIETALQAGNYIVQALVDLPLWAEEMPELDHENQQVVLRQRQTDFRCLLGPDSTFGFVGRYGDVPTNVGSGGGLQPLAVLKSEMAVAEATRQINEAVLALSYDQLNQMEDLQKQRAVKERFTYLLGPVSIALRPRLLTIDQIEALKRYCAAMWADSLTLEKMWLTGALNDYIDIEEEEMAIARLQPWSGGAAIFAADGLFSFGAHLEAS